MRLVPHRWAAPLLLLSATLATGCGDDSSSGGSSSGGAPTSGGGGAGGDGGSGGSGGAAVDPTQACVDLGLPSLEFIADGAGNLRGEVAGDFELALVDGTTFSLQERFSGCDSYIFLPDTLVVSDLDESSLWEKDLDDLIELSPKNVHYFFVSRRTDEAEATASTTAMQSRIEAELAKLPVEDAAHWAERLHVVKDRAAVIEGYVGGLLDGIGRIGFAIDREQKLRGVGFLADVNRYSSALAQQELWPWRSNLAYAANEALYMNGQAELSARLAAEDAVVLTIWDGETLEEFAEIDVSIPSASGMDAFDTLELEVESRCPLEDQLEFGNCGAWDYIASFALLEGETRHEISRFITSYHRETRWVVDASALLPLLQGDGERHFRWDFAPSWNTQPTRTRFSLRFSNQGKEAKPTSVTPLWTGAPFNSMYNATREPFTTTIPAGTKKVEFFAIVTGHGAATSQCAEFCNHQHRLTANGTAFDKEFTEAGTEEGCIAETPNLMVPNQAGTWWFGRGGWCPGQQVKPWVIDLTDVAAPGEELTLTYEGLFGGMTPPDDAGDIVLSSYLVMHQ
jgi:hypothetical protein